LPWPASFKNSSNEGVIITVRSSYERIGPGTGKTMV
jgi:hypothetical protein